MGDSSFSALIELHEKETPLYSILQYILFKHVYGLITHSSRTCFEHCTVFNFGLRFCEKHFTFFPFYFSWELRVTSWLFFTTISDYKTSRSPPHSTVLWHDWHFLLNGKPVNHRRSIEGLATYRHPQKIPRLGGSHCLKSRMTQFLKK